MLQIWETQIFMSHLDSIYFSRGSRVMLILPALFPDCNQSRARKLLIFQTLQLHPKLPDVIQ